MRTWEMWATHHPGTPTPFRRFSQSESSTRRFSTSEPVRVKVSEDPEGPFLGWVDFLDVHGNPIPAEASEVSLILPAHIFDIQFPYGSKAKADDGWGEVVQVSVTLL